MRATHVSKVHDAQFAQGAHNLASNLIGHVQLRQRHVRRAEQRVLLCRHLSCDCWDGACMREEPGVLEGNKLYLAANPT